MEITQHGTQLLSPIACMSLRNTTCAIYSNDITLFSQYITECPSLDPLHHHVMSISSFKEVIHSWNTGMTPVKHQIRLKLEPLSCLPTFLLTPQFIDDLFDGA